MNRFTLRIPTIARLAPLALTLAACSSDGEGGGTPAPTPAPPPTTITEPSAPSPGPGPTPTPTPPLPAAVNVSTLSNTSADDYAFNRWGLIEASTLATFATGWATVDSASANAAPNGRPITVEAGGKLVVLQLNAANRAPGENYVPANPAGNVLVYEIDGFRFNETRDTGLISNSVRYQASGPTTDAWLARYGIDLRKDYVVFAQGENTATNGSFVQELARGVYWLQYWGADIKRIAVLNGTLKQNYTGELRSNKIEENAVSNNGFSVKQLRVNHFGLTLPLSSFLDVVDTKLASTTAVPGFASQFIIDARPTPQFTRTAPNAAFVATHPGQFITTAWSSSGPPSNDEAGQAKSYVPVEGHVKGAVTFPWANLLENVGDNNWKYKSRAQIEALFTAAGYAPSDKATKVVVSQCRTNFEVQVNGFASRIILGYPTVHYDGSLIEYLSLVSNHPTTDLNLKAGDPAFPFRTDIPTRTQFFAASDNTEAPSATLADDGVAAYNVPTGTSPVDRKIDQAVVNKNATTTRKALDEDLAYKE